MEHGKLEIKKTKKGYAGTLVFNNKRMPVPGKYVFQDDSLDGHECTFERDSKGQVVRIFVDDKELPTRDPNPSHQVRLSNNMHQAEKPGLKRDSKMLDFFDIRKTHLPQDTRDIGFRDIDNISLKLHKGSRFEPAEKKFVFLKTGRDSGYKPYLTAKNIDLNSICCRHLSSVQALLDISSGVIGDRLLTINFYPDWRLIVGLGNESVYETSITLHHIYGIPYIPGQAIKGVVRSWVISEYFDSDEEAFKDRAFRFVFGGQAFDKYPAQAGKVMFFDALPLKEPRIEVDIMNPHFQPYYSQGQPPGDYHNPVPIPFLTVVDTPFQFLMGVKEGDNQKLIQFKNLESVTKPLELAEKWLKEALELNGIGAKTAVGYGYMKPVE